MDGHRFDDLARALGATDSGTGRRRVVGLIAVGVVAALAGGVAVAGPKPCRRVGQRCKKGGDCCAGARCRKGKCRCKLGYLDHDGVCKQECIGPSGRCDPTGIPCCFSGTSCTGVVDGHLVCCGRSNIHDCDHLGEDADSYCCSGTCGPNGLCVG
jgi:hypothetical protein